MYSYVAWIDVMGVRAIMGRSLSISANFVFKLHAAVLGAPHANLILYPVMDGVYVVGNRQTSLCRFLETVFSRIADTFVSTGEMHHRFVIKAAVAYGPVVHGRDIPQLACETLHANPIYRDSILLGMPMIQALQGEPMAPPYGVYIHESARAFSPTRDTPFRHTWWHWFHPNWHNLAVELKTELDSYYKWCTERSHPLEYEEDRIAVHRQMATEYLVDVH